MWNHLHPAKSGPFEEGTPWLLRYFDRISWYPVSAEELIDLRADMARGDGEVKIVDGEFSIAGYRKFLSDNATSIEGFRERQSAAFATERQAWNTSGELVGAPA